MGFVAALLSVKVYLAARTGLVPRVVLPPKTLVARPRFDPRPVHRKMLVRQIRLGQDEYPWKKASAVSSFSSRSRFFLDTPWVHTSSSISLPPNHRNSKMYCSCFINSR